MCQRVQTSVTRSEIGERAQRWPLTPWPRPASSHLLRDVMQSYKSFERCQANWDSWTPPLSSVRHLRDSQVKKICGSTEARGPIFFNLLLSFPFASLSFSGSKNMFMIRLSATNPSPSLIPSQHNLFNPPSLSFFFPVTRVFMSKDNGGALLILNGYPPVLQLKS